VAFDRLADASGLRVELHSSYDTALLLRYANCDRPLLILTNAVVDDLATLESQLAQPKRTRGKTTHRKIRISVKQLLRLGGSWIHDVPVVHGSVGDQAQASLAEPFPKDNVFVHCSRLELGFGAQIKYLERPLLGLQRDDLFGEVHDGTVSLDGSSNDIIVVLQIDDDDFRGICGFRSLTDADVVVGLECTGIEAY
jgi:hypothetical protein